MNILSTLPGDCVERKVKSSQTLFIQPKIMNWLKTWLKQSCRAVLSYTVRFMNSAVQVLFRSYKVTNINYH